MNKIILALILFCLSSSAQSANFFYATGAAAAAAVGCVFGQSCPGKGPHAQFNIGPNCPVVNHNGHPYYHDGINAHFYCAYDIPLDANQYLDKNTGSVVTCGAGQEVQNGACVAACPSGKVRMTVSPFACITEGAQSCSSLGINPATDFIPKCSESLPGSPTVCYNSDFSDFSIAGCPQVNCSDGSIVTYPASCPQPVTCGEGEVKTKLPAGPEVCVQQIPDQNQAPCINVGTQPLCASDAQNCRVSNGSVVCLSAAASPVPGATCYSSNAQLYCITDQPTIQTTKQTTTLPDGSVQTQETATSNVKGTTPQTTTTVTNNNSTTTTSNNQSSLNQFTSLYSQAQQQGQKIDFSKVEQNTALTAQRAKDVADALNGNVTLDGHVLDNSLDATVEADKNLAIGALSEASTPNPFDSAASPFTPLFTAVFPSAGSCSSGVHVMYFSKWSFDFEPCAKLEPLRLLLAWVFSVAAIMDIIKITFRGQS